MNNAATLGEPVAFWQEKLLINFCDTAPRALIGPLSLPSDQAFLWPIRLLEHVTARNLTDLHETIGMRLMRRLNVGDDNITHASLAGGRSVTAVQDALRRLRALGFVQWEPRYRLVDGRPRRSANAYRLTFPSEATRPHPELRRQRRRPMPVESTEQLEKKEKQKEALEKGDLDAMRRASEARALVAWHKAREIRMRKATQGA